jgi:hypothetical protein
LSTIRAKLGTTTVTVSGSLGAIAARSVVTIPSLLKTRQRVDRDREFSGSQPLPIGQSASHGSSAVRGAAQARAR